MSEQEKGSTRRDEASSAAGSRLGSTASFDGRLESQEDTTIEGRFKGTIVLTSATLSIGKGAMVEANVESGNVILEGELTGTITASDRVQIRETASMSGDITAGRISISSGARFKGSLKIGKS